VPGKPERLLLCRYWGLNNGNQSFRLATKRLVRDPAKVSRYATALDGLREWPEGTYSCPEDDGSSNLAFFGYRGDAPAVVEISLTGCEGAINGRAGWFELGPVAAMLNADLPYPKTEPGRGQARG
jgi:hypothetical protein